MTLILTTLRPSEVLITSDGRSMTTRAGKVLSVRNDLQKIFPVTDHPVAIMQHGENIIDGRPIGDLIDQFASQQNIGNMTIQEIADELHCFFHPKVRKRLLATRNPESGCGLIVAGFSMHQKEPAAVENFWLLKGDTLDMSERRWKPTTIIASGNGQRQIPKLRSNRVSGVPVEKVRQYHAELMNAAIQADVKDNTVGGHVSELLITREKWTWLAEPAKKPERTGTKKRE